MRIHKNVSFILPYLKSARKLVPLERLDTIKGYKVDLYKSERSYGSIVTNGSRANINLLITNNYVLENKQRPIFLMVILDSLAHELAHLVHWKHTPDHMMLQVKILRNFVRVMKKNGVKDTYKRIRL